MRFLTILVMLMVFQIGHTSAHAQLISGGLKFGMTQTIFAGNLAAGETTWSSISGVAGGAASELRLIGGLSAVGELLYIQMGSKTRIQFNSFPGLLTIRASYLSIPVLAQFRFDSSGILRPRVFFGGASLFVLESATLVEADESGQVFIDENDSIESFDYGLITGAGIDVHLINQRFTMEVRYYRGQNDVTKPSSATGEATALNNQGWAIMAGVLF